MRDALQEEDPLPELDDTAGSDERAKALYLRLLDLLDTTVSIDVLSGTSTGGINAALPGPARALSWDLGPLRDLWLTSDAFETLLRDPAHKQPLSLLQDDGVVFRELLHGMQELVLAARGGKSLTGKTPDAVTTSTQGFIPTTLLTDTGRSTDPYGAQVQDEDHRGLFVFDERVLGNESGKQALSVSPSWVPTRPRTLPVHSPTRAGEATGTAQRGRGRMTGDCALRPTRHAPRACARSIRATDGGARDASSEGRSDPTRQGMRPGPPPGRQTRSGRRHMHACHRPNNPPRAMARPRQQRHAAPRTQGTAPGDRHATGKGRRRPPTGSGTGRW